MSVSTGYYMPDPRGGGAVPPGGRITVFDAHAPGREPISLPYTVREDMALLLTAFNMPAGGQMHTELAILSVPEPGPGRPFPGYVDIRAMRPSIGGADNWVIDGDHPQMLIALPGTYRFVLSDPCLLEETELAVEAVPLRLSALPALGALVLR
jgi:hypothetical protein